MVSTRSTTAGGLSRATASASDHASVFSLRDFTRSPFQSLTQLGTCAKAHTLNNRVLQPQNLAGTAVKQCQNPLRCKLAGKHRGCKRSLMLQARKSAQNPQTAISFRLAKQAQHFFQKIPSEKCKRSCRQIPRFQPHQILLNRGRRKPQKSP